MKKNRGNIMDFLTVLITILALSILFAAYMECTNLLMKKQEISQISRKYILKMETEGYLTEPTKNELVRELKKVGLQQIELSGTTLTPVAYGDAVCLKVKGVIPGKMMGTGEEMWKNGFVSGFFSVEDEKVSTAKN